MCRYAILRVPSHLLVRHEVTQRSAQRLLHFPHTLQVSLCFSKQMPLAHCHHILYIFLVFVSLSFPQQGAAAAFFMTNPHPSPSSTSSSSSAQPNPSETTLASNTNDSPGDMRFGKFLIPKASIIARSPLHAAAFVNLRPIVPGHVLIMPERIVPHLADLTTDEYTDLWLLVRTVQDMLQQHYHATAFNVAVQDGRAAGQSVPHVHVHILPRTNGDFARNDDIYEALEEWAPRSDMKKERTTIEVPEDEDRVDRTAQMMADEAATYRRLLQAGEEVEDGAAKL